MKVAYFIGFTMKLQRILFTAHARKHLSYMHTIQGLAEPTYVQPSGRVAEDDCDGSLEFGEISIKDMSPDERRFYFSRSWAKGMCAVCAEPVVDWLTHMNLSSHQARYAICRHISSPEKYLSLVKNLWHFLHYDVALIKDFDVKKDSKRRQRLHDVIKFLHQNNVILYSVYRWVEEKMHWARPVEFAKCLLAGEAILRSSVIDRFSRIFPRATAGEIKALTDSVMDFPAMSAMYDTLQLNSLLPHPQRRTHKLTQVMKRALLIAMCGEMSWFVGKSRATDRAFNNALFPPSDTLVVHVLTHHAVEAIMIEVVHHYIQKIVKETLPIWSDFRGRLPYIAGEIAWHVRPRKVFPSILKNSQKSSKSDPGKIQLKPQLQVDMHRLTPIPNVLPKPTPSWKFFIRGHNLDKRGYNNYLPKVLLKCQKRVSKHEDIPSIQIQMPVLANEPCASQSY